MANKQYMKKSEAKILIFLNQVPNHLKTLNYISRKTKIEYGYLIRVLAGIIDKEWIFKHRADKTVYYDINKNKGEEFIELLRNAAVEVISDGNKRKEIRGTKDIRSYPELKD